VAPGEDRAWLVSRVHREITEAVARFGNPHGRPSAWWCGDLLPANRPPSGLPSVPRPGRHPTAQRDGSPRPRQLFSSTESALCSIFLPPPPLPVAPSRQFFPRLAKWTPFPQLPLHSLPAQVSTFPPRSLHPRLLDLRTSPSVLCPFHIDAPVLARFPPVRDAWSCEIVAPGPAESLSPLAAALLLNPSGPARSPETRAVSAASKSASFFITPSSHLPRRTAAPLEIPNCSKSTSIHT